MDFNFTENELVEAVARQVALLQSYLILVEQGLPVPENLQLVAQRVAVANKIEPFIVGMVKELGINDRAS